MINVSDLLKILEKIPLWKQLKELPAKIEDFERRLSALEKNLETDDSVKKCPKCGSKYFVLTDTKPNLHLGIVGVQDRQYTCEKCSYSEVESG